VGGHAGGRTRARPIASPEAGDSGAGLPHQFAHGAVFLFGQCLGLPGQIWWHGNGMDLGGSHMVAADTLYYIILYDLAINKIRIAGLRRYESRQRRLSIVDFNLSRGTPEGSRGAATGEQEHRSRLRSTPQASRCRSSCGQQRSAVL